MRYHLIPIKVATMKEKGEKEGGIRERERKKGKE